MLKHIYRIVTCLIVFVVSIVIFSKNIHKEHFEQEIKTYEMTTPTFPVVSANFGKYTVNTMHGYLTSIDSTLIRDGLIPVKEDRKISLVVDVNETIITQGNYEVVDIKTGEVKEEGKISEFNKENDKIKAGITLENIYEDNKEYSLTVILITDKGDKIKYHSRIKKFDTTNTAEIIAYALEFHNNVLDKEKAKKVVSYIEPDKSMDNTNLAYVNIHSSLNLISYGDLAPKKITKVRPKLREVNSDTAVVELEFYVEANTPSGKEIYKVLEAFRIRWTATRMYLLGYDRTMETVFDINMVSVAKNEFKLGITNVTDANYVSTEDESKLAFVRNGDLWYYNTAINQMYEIFSFKQGETDYIRDNYDNHDIKILNMDEFGNMNFMVYGYMNGGEYEGRTGIVLYKYLSAQERIEEQAYIPVDVPFDILNGYVSDFAYVNAHNVFFFSIGGGIYSYDLITDELKTLAQNVKMENMIMPEGGNFMAWMSSDNEDAQINIMNLDSEEITVLKGKEGSCIRLLGGIESQVFYGYADVKDISSSADGTQVIPINKVEIASMTGEVIKEYEPEVGFVESSQVMGNKIKFYLVKKDDNGYYIPAGEDYIFNSEMEKTQITTNYRVTDKTMIEWYLSIPASIDIPNAPQINDVAITEVEKRVIKVDFNKDLTDKFYVFSYHGLEAEYDSAGEAIKVADARMGVVYDNCGNLIWERGNIQDSVSLTVKKIDGKGSMDSCVRMLIKSSHYSVSDDVKFDFENESIIGILKANMKATPVNLTGATLDEILYYVSGGRPVIAMASSTKAVLITGYTGTTVTYMDMNNGMVKKKTAEAKKLFAGVGNVFISYVE